MARLYCSKRASQQFRGSNDFSTQLKALGGMGISEKAVLAASVVVVLLLFLRDPQFINGYGTLFPKPEFISNSSIALLAVLPLFFVPHIEGKDEGKEEDSLTALLNETEYSGINRPYTGIITPLNP